MSRQRIKLRQKQGYEIVDRTQSAQKSLDIRDTWRDKRGDARIELSDDENEFVIVAKEADTGEPWYEDDMVG